MNRSPNKMIAFYGSKGGTGRSFLLANVAYALAAHGKKVLIVDCDLEAPGIGDYFDVKLGDLSAKWRSSEGLLDLIVKRQDFLEAAEEDEFKKRILSKLDEPKVLVNVGPVGHTGEIRLLGPGSHVWTAHSPMGYVQEILEFDWTAFISSRSGESYLRALGEALRECADIVLVDARTGYNFHSLTLLQIWKPLVVGVSTIAWQSLDGLSRMMRVFADSDVETRIVWSKLSEKSIAERRMAGTEAEAKHILVEKLFPHSPSLGELPFIPELLRGDRLLWGRDEFWAKLDEPATNAVSPERAYVDEFSRLLDKLAGISMSEAVLREFAGKSKTASVNSQRAKTAFDRSRNEDDDPQIYGDRTKSFLESVRTYCMVRREDKAGSAPPVVTGASSEGLGSTATDGSSTTAGARPTDLGVVPSIDRDQKIREWRLENRERVRVELALLLEEGRTGENKELWTAARIKEVEDENFVAALPIPPAHIAKVDNEKSRERQESTFWSDFGRVLDGGAPLEGDEAKSVQPHDEDQRRAHELKVLVVESRRAKTRDRVTALGAAIMRALSGDGFRIPTDDKGLIRWNALDALSNYVNAVRDLCRIEWDPIAIEQLDAIQKAVIECLARVKPADSIRTWDLYFRWSIIGRRLVWQHRDDAPSNLFDKVPHGMTELLSAGEADALERALGEDVDRTLPDDPGDAVPAAAKAFAVITLRLLSGRAAEGYARFESLCESLLSANRTHSSRPDWKSLIQELESAADELRSNRLASRLARLALRLNWQRGMAVSPPAQGLVVALFRAGLPIHQAGFVDKLIESSEGKGATNYRWWPAARLCQTGASSSARDILFDVNAVSNKVESEGDTKIDDGVFGWRLDAVTQLGDPNVAEHLEGWWTSRRGGLNVLTDEQSWWLRLAERAAQIAVMPLGDRTRLLERAVSIIGRRQAPGPDMLRAVLRIRLLLAKLTRLGGFESAPARELARSDMAGLEVDIEAYKEGVRKVANFGPDRRFAEYLGLQWAETGLGDGMFKGDEAALPERGVLAQMLVEYAEILLYAGKRTDAANVAVEVEQGVLSGYDETEDETSLALNRLAFCYPIAAASALRYAASTKPAEKPGLMDRARRHRDRDLAANGEGRGLYYERIFRACGLDVPAFEPAAMRAVRPEQESMERGVP